MGEPAPRAPLPAADSAAARRDLARAGGAALGLFLAAILVGLAIGAGHGYPVSRVWTALVAAALLLTPYFALSGPAFRRALAARVARPDREARRNALALLLVPASLSALLALRPGGPDWTGPARIALYLLVPFLLVGTAGRGSRPGLRDLLAILLLWLPVELDLLHGAWSEPREEWEPLLNVLLATTGGVFLFAVVRGLDGLEYTFRPDRRIWTVGLAAFLAAAPFLLASGLASGFLRFRGHPRDPGTVLGSFVVVFLFNALPEELLFRGLIQNALARRIGRFLPALLIASLVFGLSHLNSGRGPNWPFAALATLAGLFYGVAYRKGGVTASALAHTFVNVGLHAFFRFR